LSRLLALWKKLTDSLWFLPAGLTLVGAALAFLLVRADPLLLGDADATELGWLIAGTADGARGVLGAIATSIITVTGVTFSVTIVALQLASQQFTPRVLRQFMSDGANQLVLGVFIGTFTYTLLVQRTVRGEMEGGEPFVPAVAITAAVLFALVSIGFFIFFIDHVARSIRADVIMARVARETVAAIRRLRDDEDDDGIEEPAEAPSLDDPGRRVVASRSGYIEAIGAERLVELAAKHDLVLRAEVDAGDFAVPGSTLLTIVSGEAPERVDNALRAEFVFGPGRTPHQDPELGIVELVDIAVKALSPGINDPTTAVIAIDRIGEVILAFGRSGPLRSPRRDAAGRIRLTLHRSHFDRAVGMAFDQIRHYGVGNPRIAVKLMRTQAMVATLLPPECRPPLEHAIRQTLAGAERQVEDPDDLARVRAAAAAALERARTEHLET
jgi:uncharacterized membrane protein